MSVTQTKCSNPGCFQESQTFALLIEPDGKPTEVSYCKGHTARLGMDYVVPDPRRRDIHNPSGRYEDCTLHAVLITHEPRQHVLVLRNRDASSVFVVETGYVEAALAFQIARKLRHPTPSTHEFMVNIVRSLGASPAEIVVHGYDFAGFYKCFVAMESGNGLVKVECRVTDAVAVSILTDLPLKIDTAYLGRPTRG